MPKKGSDYAPRPALPDGSRALDPRLVVTAALVTLYEDAVYEHAVAAGDTEGRDALLYLTYSRLIEQAEAALAEIAKKTGFTKASAERVIEGSRRRQTLVERHGDGWHSLIEKLDYDLDKRGEPEKRSAA